MRLMASLIQLQTTKLLNGGEPSWTCAYGTKTSPLLTVISGRSLPGS